MNAAPSGYAISAGARAALAKTFRLEYDLYHFLKQRLLGQVTEVCTDRFVVIPYMIANEACFRSCSAERWIPQARHDDEV